MDDRTLRIFISSTFLDMFDEREELVRRAFPGLRLLCESRGVTCVEVDLRWGITEPQSKARLSLSICFDEIRRSGVVIGLLGEYYGSIPYSIPADLVARYPWISDRVGTGCSYTEWELLCGVLDLPESKPDAFFYFRDPAYPVADPKFRDTEPGKVEKLRALKDRIRREDHPLVDGYENPASVRSRIRADLEAWINRRYPASSKPDAEEREDWAHSNFAALRLRHFRGRDVELSRLDRWADRGGPPMVLTGAEGVGKSALLARWIEHRRGRGLTPRPWWRGGRAVEEGAPVAHFLSASTGSIDWREVLRRLALGLARSIGIEPDWPDDEDALTPAFANLLEMAARAGRPLLVIDGLDQLAGRGEVLDLHWLPPSIPKGVRLIVSTSGGPTLDALGARGWASLELGPIGAADRGEAVVSFFQSYGKTLEDAHLDALKTAEGMDNPLFLMTAADLLRTVGRSQLAGEVAAVVALRDFEALIERRFDRWEGDIGPIAPGLVGNSMRLIWASRSGLSDPELLDLLGPDPDSPLPWLAWRPLREAIGASMIDRSGLLDFAHEPIRRAAYRRYVVPDGEAVAHLRLADYFRARPWSPRKAEELPHHLERIGAWDDLADILVDPEYLRLAWDDRPSDLMERWAAVEAHSAHRMIDAYRPWLDPTGAWPEAAWPVAMLLHDAGHHAEALDLTARIVGRAGLVGDPARLVAGLNALAIVARSLGRPAEALVLLGESARFLEKAGNPASEASHRINRAAVHLDLGQDDLASGLYAEAEQICRRDRLWRLLGDALGGLGLVCLARGDRRAADRFLREQEATCRRLGDLGSLQRTLAHQGVLRLKSGEFRRALRLFAEAESICRRLGDHVGLRDGLANQAMAWTALGDHDRAVGLLGQAEATCRARGDLAGLAEVLAKQGWVIAGKLGLVEIGLRMIDEAEGHARRSASTQALGCVIDMRRKAQGLDGGV